MYPKDWRSNLRTRYSESNIHHDGQDTMPEHCSDTELLWLLSGASGRKTVEKGVPGAGSPASPTE